VTKTDWALSPNHNARRGTIRLIVLHCDASPRESSTLNWLANPVSKASYHALIHRDGWVSRMVPDERAAWHAGVSEWNGVRRVNDISLGLAFSNRNDGQEPLTDAQLDIAKAVVQYWCQRYDIEAVVGHKDVAPTRKTDPYRAPNFRVEDYAGFV
jgi:N-acetylmuramoyl-L-alanine amidase